MTPKCPDCKRDQDDCICASPASAPEVRESVIEAIAEALGNAYDCTRVWSAWSYGTMSQDDFSLVAEDRSRLEEIADAAMIAAAPTPPVSEDRKDAELLDYIQNHGATIQIVPMANRTFGFEVGGLHKSRKLSVREAIDAAMQEDKP